MNDELNDNISKLDAVPDADIQRSCVTITQFMHNRGIEGGVALDQPGASSSGASAMLVSQDGRKYDIGKLVAQGGMGAILSAKDLNIRRTVAMKVLLEPDKAAEDQILRFIEEAQITGQMEHPGIVPVHELGVDARGNVFYTMKLVKGDTLDGILDGIREGKAEFISKYRLPHLIGIFIKVCEAMAFAHSKNVVHRDLKPENIMVGEFGEVLVMDWGLGKVLRLDCKSDQSDQSDQSDSSDSSDKQEASFIDSLRSVSADANSAMTMEGAIMGTPLYMAPEQAYGRISEIDPRSDIYALGAILFCILTLNPPVNGETVNEILLKVVHGEIESPQKFARRHKSKLPHLAGGQIPGALSHVAMKALSLERNARYQSVKELQNELEAYLGGFATEAEEAGALTQIILLVKRHKKEFSIIAVLFLLLMLVSAHFVFRLGKERDLAVKEKNIAEESEKDALKAQSEAEKSEKTAIEANEKTLSVSREAAPRFLREAVQYFGFRNWRNALDSLAISAELDSSKKGVWVLKGLAEFVLKDYAAAKISLGNAANIAGQTGDKKAGNEKILLEFIVRCDELSKSSKQEDIQVLELLRSACAFEDILLNAKLNTEENDAPGTADQCSQFVGLQGERHIPD